MYVLFVYENLFLFEKIFIEHYKLHKIALKNSS
jgi:hypothetical protein